MPANRELYQTGVLLYIECIAINASVLPMSSITVRNLDDKVKASLRVQAAEHGWSMEQEARHILQQGVSGRGVNTNVSFARRVQQRFAGQGVDALPIPERRPSRTPPTF